MALFEKSIRCPVCNGSKKEEEIVTTVYGWKACRDCNQEIEDYRKNTGDDQSYSEWELSSILKEEKAKPKISFDPSSGAIYSIAGDRGKSMFVFDNKCIIDTALTVGSELMGNATDGRKIIFYKDIVGIQFKQPGSLLGFIQLETAAHIKNENSANFYSENSFVFQTITDEIWAAYQYIVERVESMKNSESGAPLSPMDELKKLKEVFDLGIITEEEFSQKKKKLLDL